MKSIPRLLFVCLLALLFCVHAAAGESLSLPRDLEEIQDEAFAGCESLSGVLTIPTDVQVSESAFDNTPGLTVLRGVAVVGDNSTPWNGTLNGDVWTAVSAFCETRNLDCTYTTDAAAALGDGYDVIITVGFGFADTVSALQTQFPDARFICLDTGIENQQGNVYCVQYKTEQSGFMAGYAAVRMGYRSLGFLGGIAVPDVVGFGEGFVAGANQAAAELDITDDVSVAYAYTGTFAPDPAVYEKALSWYDRGVEVIFSCGGNISESVIQAADEKNGLMIGVDSDQYNLGGGGRVVTSAMKNLGFSATDALALILDGGWNSLGGQYSRLGVISADPDGNHVCLAPHTQFGSGFTYSVYEAMVAGLYNGTYPSGGIGITVITEPEPDLPRVAVVGDESTPWNGTLDWDVKTAVSAFCEDRNIDFLYTTDAASALEDGYDTIITVGFLASGAVSGLQTEYPDARFICLDSTVSQQQDNVYCVQYRTDQAGFMAGYAAARMGYFRLGFIGGKETADVIGYEEGFMAGATQVREERGLDFESIEILRTFTGTFEESDIAYQKASKWCDLGAQIIFSCGGDICHSVLRAVNENNRLMIGVDTDQSNLDSAVITSAMKNLGFSATDALTRILDGGWDSLGGTSVRLGVVSPDPAQNHVCLAPHTQFGNGFSYADYEEMVAKLYDGTYPSAGLQAFTTTFPLLPSVAVIASEASINDNLVFDLLLDVTEYCDAWDIDLCHMTDAEAALQAGYNVIFTVGSMASEPIAALQTQYPDARFICLDAAVENQQSNVYCTRYRTDQAGFMAGYAAVRMGYRFLGFLGGKAVDDVVGYQDGFVRGANQAAAELGITDEVTVASAYTDSFEAGEAAYQTAAYLYDEGVEIIFSCGGDIGQSVIRAADEKDRMMIGSDSNQSGLGSEARVAFSAIKNLGFSASDALFHILDFDWKTIGGTSPTLGVVGDYPTENHVCLGPRDPNAPVGSGFSWAEYREMVTRLHNGAYPSGEIQITVVSEQDAVPVTVSSSAELQALGDTLTGTVVVIPENNDPIDLSWPVTLEGTLRVETGGNQFSSLRICEGGSLTLAEGSFLQTLSSWDPVNSVPLAVAQVWVNGGSLDASLGTIADYSTVYITGGSVLLAEGADGVYLIGGAADEASLRAFLADPRMDEFFLEADMTLTGDVTLTRNTQIHPHVTVTVPAGVTLTVSSGCTLNVTDVDSALIIAAGGQLTVEDGGTVNGNVQWEQNP